LELTNTENSSVAVSKTGTFSSELLQSDQCSYIGFRVFFDKKIILYKNTTYCLRASILGSPSLHGLNCVRSVQCSGVTFTFKNSRYPNTNGTTITQGQFAELLFTFNCILNDSCRLQPKQLVNNITHFTLNMRYLII